MRPARIVLATLGCAAIGTACPSPDCACPPALSTAVVTVMVTASGQPLPGAGVTIQQLGSPTCADTSGTPLHISAIGITPGSGILSQTIVSPLSGEACIRALARRSQGQLTDSALSEPAILDFRFEGSKPDSVLLVVAFP